VPNLRLYDRLPSTNDQAWLDGRAAFRDRGERFLGVAAREQTAGRGRAGRAWSSPADDGMYLSCYCRLDWPPERAAWLTLAAGLAVRGAVMMLVPVTPWLKWPNDLIAPDGSGRKLGGILTETRVDGPRIADAVIGVGLNLTTPGGGWGADAAARPAALDEFAGAGAMRPPAAFAAQVAEEIEFAVEQLGREDVGDLLQRARDAMPLWGRRVTATHGTRVIDGVAKDLAADGGLVVRLDSGAEVVVHAGDVRVAWAGE
jgi:BirA family transcriptional regulator, biotin operon repressor / biotin---[acetyl-CoA-carboxylase] ligase